MNGLEIARAHVEGRHLLRLRGELDLVSAPTLAGLLDAMDGDSGDVVVDLAGVSFVDSSGLTVLLEAHSRAIATGRALVVRHPAPQAQRVIDLSGLDGVLVIEDGAGTTDGQDASGSAAVQAP